MMRLPDRLKRHSMGVRVPLQKIWPRHRRWVRSHSCCVPECQAVAVDFAHLRSAANAGKGQRPHDSFGVSLCRLHHDEQHRIGTTAFGKKYGINLWDMAAEFARRSPDWEMRTSLKLVRAEYDAEFTREEQGADF
jgi:Putative HNHc nuclease